MTVRLFGIGQAFYEGQALDGFPSRQYYRLFCYLLLNRSHPHSRERLAAVFWAEYPTATSRRYLRTCLWRLRHSLLDSGVPADEYLCCDNDSVAIRDSGPYWLDVEAFKSAIRVSRSVPGHQLAEEQARELERVERLYTGDLVECIYDDWCIYDRERLRLMHLDLLFKLLAYHEGTGTYEQGLDYAQRILAHDPTREKVHRQAMRLYWLMDAPVEALAQYWCCVQVLREELGVEPTSKTTSLYKQMLHDRFDPSQWAAQEQNGLPGRLARREDKLQVRDLLLGRLLRLEIETQQARAELHDLRRLVEKALDLERRD